MKFSTRSIAMTSLIRTGKLLSWGLFLFCIVSISPIPTTVSPAIAQSCISPPEGLIGWWAGDEDASDISGNDNHAQLTDGAQAGIPGKVGGAFQFDGVNDIVNTPVTLPAKGTLDLWLNPASLEQPDGGVKGIFGTFGTANGNDRLWLVVTGSSGGPGVGAHRLAINLGSCCINDIDIPSPLTAGKWTHLALTFDYANDNYILYVDGQSVVSSSASRNTPSQLLSFGGLKSNFNQDFFFNGLVDEVELFNRVLEPSEIQAIFEAGSAGKCKGPTPIEIDIKPGTESNSINLKSKGKIPVAILSTEDLDAVEEVDKTSLTFGKTGNENSLTKCSKNGKDVNNDGLDDLICRFDTQNTGFQTGDVEGILRGMTVDGLSIEGRDSVKIIN